MLDTLKRHQDDLYCNPPATEAQINQLLTVWEPIPPGSQPRDYLDLLRYANGIQINNVILNSIDELLHCSLEQDDFLQLGHEGNLDSIVFHLPSAEYRVVNFFDLRETFESFDYLKDLIAYLLREQGRMS